MKLAIFDMDGTLIDTIGDIHACLNKTLLVYGFQPVTLEQTKEYVGGGIRQLLINAVGEMNFMDMMEKYFRAVYQDIMTNTTHLFSSVPETLEYIRKSDMKAVILSNKIRPIVNDLVHHFEIENYLDGWYGGDTFGIKKPSPVPVTEIMKLHNAEPSKTIMIGDASTDVMAGAQAGAKTCFCAYGYGTLKNVKPDFQADRPEDLIRILEEF